MSAECYGVSGAGKELLANVMQLVPGMPLSVAKDKAAQALRRFAREAGVWRYHNHQVQVCAGDQVLDIPAVEGIEVVRVESIYAAACGCSACESELPQQYALRGVCGCGCGQQQGWVSTLPDQVLFNTEWGKAHTLRLVLVLAPARGADTFPPSLLDEHLQSIQDGALALAYAIPQQAWSDPSLAMLHRQLFEQALAEAKAQGRLDMLPGRPAYRAGGYR